MHLGCRVHGVVFAAATTPMNSRLSSGDIVLFGSITQKHYAQAIFPGRLRGSGVSTRSRHAAFGCGVGGVGGMTELADKPCDSRLVITGCKSLG